MRKDLKKKLKLLAIFGVSAFVLTGALVIWAAVAIFNRLENTTGPSEGYASSIQGNSSDASTNENQSLIDLNKPLIGGNWAQTLLLLQSEKCWTEVSESLNPETLLTKPLAPQWAEIKNSCWEQKSQLAPEQESRI